MSDPDDVAAPPVKGSLLVATPRLGDPNFDRTVLLLLDHGDDGTLGLVLNRPSETAVGDPLPHWAALAAHPPVVFVGGPVQLEAVVALARAGIEGPPEIDDEAWQPVLGRLGLVDLNREPEAYGEGIDQVRLFAGYAGWSPGQLQDEIDEGAWYVLEADPEDALSPYPDRLWSFVLRRQGGHLGRVANYPPDPTWN